MDAQAPEPAVTSLAATQVDMLRRARQAEDHIALDFMVVNESYLLAPYRQAALWLLDAGMCALSGVASVERNAPYVLWLEAVLRTLRGDRARVVTADELPEALQVQWAEWLPPYGLWVPIRVHSGTSDHCPGGVLFARDNPWEADEIERLQDWIGMWALARHAVAPVARGARLWRRMFSFSTGWKIALLALGALFLVRTPLSVIAPGEIIARDPMPVRAPIDGVVREFFVQPNQSVRAGDPLFAFDIVQLASKLEVATQALQTAEAEMRQFDQQALHDSKARASLAAARGNVAEKRAEVEYLRNQRGRSRMLAAEDGIAIFDDPQEWIGRPVGTGERIMRIASDQRKEIEAWIPVGDAIPLAHGSPVRMYLSASPLDPVIGSVRYLAHDAVRRPDGTYAFRVRAELQQPTSHRIGLKGTAHLSGQTVTLAYWIFRRPLAALREFLGHLSGMKLPPLRQELALHVGPRLADGQPSWTVQDPVRNQFFRVDWLSFEILVNWTLGDPQAIADAVRLQTPLDADPEDVNAVLDFLVHNQLIMPHEPGVSRALAKHARERRKSWWLWLIHNYLFFRVPVTHPDRWLSALLKPAAIFFSRRFALLTTAAFALGVMLVFRQWDVFRATLVDQFTPSGIASYALALVFVKVLHELGHGLAARRHGCHVPTMGIAFIVLWPMPYTDVNEAWKLPDRRARLQIGAAGVSTELVIAVWATLAWGLMEDGYLRSVAFLLATTTWVSTLLVNLSPFMRFDGYFLLSDLLDVPNLHARSFALARWKLRELLFNFGDEPPEFFPRRRAAGLIFFAWFTWVYRLIIFLGIALLVYSFFVKALGIVLFLVEIIWFILLPITAEMRVWRSRWTDIVRSTRMAKWVLLFAVLGGLLVVPLPWSIGAAGMLYTGDEYAVYAPEGARVESIHVRDADHVEAMAPLFTLSSNLLDERLLSMRSRVARLAAQSDAAEVNAELRSRLLVLQADLRTARSSLRAIELQIRQHRPAAPHAGRFRLADPDLRPGVWVARNERLATVIDESRWHAQAYVTEQEVHRLEVGGSALFFPDGGAHAPVQMRLTDIARDSTHVLADGLFAHSQGGSVIAREVEGRFIPEQAVFRLTFETEERPEVLTGQSWRGRVSLSGSFESVAARWLRAATAVIWREAGW